MNSYGETGTSGASAAHGAGANRRERRSEYSVWCGYATVWRGLVSHTSRLGGTDKKNAKGIKVTRLGGGTKVDKARIES
jgi:hypothetical protein